MIVPAFPKLYLWSPWCSLKLCALLEIFAFGLCRAQELFASPHREILRLPISGSRPLNRLLSHDADLYLQVTGMLGIVVVGSLAVFVRASQLAIVSEQVARQLRKRVFHCLVFQRMRFFDENDTGRLVNRLSTDTVGFGFGV